MGGKARPPTHNRALAEQRGRLAISAYPLSSPAPTTTRRRDRRRDQRGRLRDIPHGQHSLVIRHPARYGGGRDARMIRPGEGHDDEEESRRSRDSPRRKRAKTYVRELEREEGRIERKKKGQRERGEKEREREKRERAVVHPRRIVR